MYKFYKKALTILAIPLIALSSCKSAKDVTYFNDLSKQNVNEMTSVATPYQDPVIKPKDILQISIQTINPQSSGIEISGAKAEANSGYLVSDEGYINLLLLGKLKVGGLTTKETEKLVYEKVSSLYKDPVVTVRILNFTITVLGEVNRPGQQIVLNEKVSILDAIGMAGDMTIYGKRENVLLIREENGMKKFVRFDLNSSQIFQSKYYYLKQNDIVYIEPGKARAAATDITTFRNLTLATSLLSVTVLIISQFNK